MVYITYNICFNISRIKRLVGLKCVGNDGGYEEGIYEEEEGEEEERGRVYKLKTLDDATQIMNFELLTWKKRVPFAIFLEL